MTPRARVLVVSALVAGCSGTVVVDGDGSGGGDATTGASTVSTTVTTTGAGPCDDHADCPGQLCQFGTGTCIQSCTFDDECPPGDACDPCATSSCPGCLDCTRGCVPGVPPPVPCADHSDCGGNPGENVCVFSEGFCARRCGAGSPPCPPGTVCDDCATGSCPGCRDCVGACLGAQK